jgi:hypothetical protein
MADEGKKSSYWIVWVAMVVIGFGTFIYLAASGRPDQAWKAYLINFLIWSAIAQGGMLFSTLMHTVKAKWSGSLSGLSEAFTGFFPVSLILFLFLFLGGAHVFPWSHGHDLHGKEVWLNIPFLFTRDLIALFILYGLGFGYLYYSLQLKKVDTTNGKGIIRTLFRILQGGRQLEPEVIRKRMDLLAILYMLAFALVLSLIGYDLVMALDPHWISTLFGAYTFVKAIYVGLGGLIIFAAVMHLNPKNDFTLPSSQFHDIGKLFFAFCLVWADFFYVQLVVIWYGNIPEETAYVIERVMMVPWKYLAWFVFAVSFVIPFFILLNKKVKTMPAFMMVLAACMIAGIWLEHLLLVGPSLSHSVHTLPLGINDVLISLGFLGLMLLALNSFLRQFPELARTEKREVS